MQVATKRLQAKGGCIKDDAGGTGLGGKWEGGFTMEGTHVYLCKFILMYGKKPSQYCEAIICQLK